MTARGPAIDPELAAFLPSGAAERPFVDGLDGVAILRAAMAEFEESLDEVRVATGANITETDISGVPAVVISPPDPVGRFGAILNVHGGGLIAGSHRSVLTANAITALDLGCVMVVPDYRLAPEHPYPAGLDDVEAVWNWLRAGGAGETVDTDRLVILGGSAGGCLAAGLVIRLIGQSQDVPRALMLVQPQLDDRNITPSTYELENAHFWDRRSNVLAWSLYLSDTDEVPPEAAPARAQELTQFPPTCIEIAQVDVFRDEQLDFAARLSRAGVPVEAHQWAGAFHGFDGLASTRIAQRAVAARREFLHSHLSDN